MGLADGSEMLFHRGLVVPWECPVPYHISAGRGSFTKCKAQRLPQSHPSQSLPGPRQSGSQRLVLDVTLPNAEITGKRIRMKCGNYVSPVRNLGNV